MTKVISQCPGCDGTLRIAALRCPECGMELWKDFSLSLFDRLTEEEYAFLIAFLGQRGNLKNVQSELGISYPTAKKKLDTLLVHLELAEPEQEEREMWNFSKMEVNRSSTAASEIVKAKLLENGGRVIVRTARGLPCEIIAQPDGKSFVSPKLPVKPPYEYRVFDTVVDVLKANGGRARKGNGRSFKLGHPECDESTVVGAIAKNYAGKKEGDSVYDPVFVLAAVLEWADIVTNQRGELILTAEYRSKL